MLAEGVLWNSRRENYQFVLFKEEFAEVNAAHVRHNPAVPRVPTVRAITPHCPRAARARHNPAVPRVPAVRAVTPEGFHLYSPTLPAVCAVTPPSPLPTVRAVTPEGFHLHSPTLPAEARRRLRGVTPTRT